MKKHAPFISLIILIFLCFGVGYWTGLHPKILEQYINLTQHEVLFYVDDPGLLKTQDKERLINSSHVRIKYITEKPETADISLLSLSNFRKIELDSKQELKTNRELQLYNKLKPLRKKISPDFLIHELDSSKGLPLLWQYENKKLSIEVLLPKFKVDSNANQKIYDVMSSLLDTEFQEHWVAHIDWNTTLLKMDESVLPENKKALFIRKLNLNDVIFK